MDLGYQKSKKYSTLELPWVICSPPLTFEFNNATSIEFGITLAQFAANEDWIEESLIVLAAQLLLSVETENNVVYALGDAESIRSLIANTHPEFVRDCVMGWFYLEGAARLAAKKKLRLSNGR